VVPEAELVIVPLPGEYGDPEMEVSKSAGVEAYRSWVR
jgi:hypothetical protein